MRQRLLILFASASVAMAAFAASARADGGPIMALANVRPGMDCTGETVVKGTTIASFDVQVLDVVQTPNEGPRILIRVSGPAVEQSGVAEGFSGSPIYCADAAGTLRIIGAISEGIGEYGNKVALATPIEVMLGEPIKPPVSARRLAVASRPLLGPLTHTGHTPPQLRVLQQAGKRAGRLVLSAPSGPNLSFPLQALVPGASVAVGYSTGAISLGAIGTVTYLDGQTVYGFGHELDGAGRRSLLLEDAYVYDVVDNPDPSTAPSYKLAAPGHPLGTLTSDTPNAVIGQIGAGPPLIPVDVSAHDLDTGRTLTLNSQVADETDVGLPMGGSSIDAITPLAIGEAAIEIYNGAPANESGSICLRIELRGSRAPLSFCKRYVGTGAAGDSGFQPPELANATTADVATALGLLDQEAFATLHVTRVDASIAARRGLAEASILSARAPLVVRAGQLVRVRLVVRSYRGPLRAISVRLRIPRDARGLLVATLRGAGLPSSSGSGSGAGQSLAALLAASLSGPPSPGAPVKSLAELRKAFAGIASYDGISASFLGRPEHEHLYRDPALMITGRAKLTLLVKR